MSSTSAAPPSNLRELQSWFASAITHSGGALAGRPSREHSQQAECLITPGPRLSPSERLQLYNDGYFARLVECLADDYPALAFALGEEAFAELARDFIAAHPSRSSSLNSYGEPLAAYCRTSAEPWAAFAADLARLEWALVEVVHAPASVKLGPDALARVPAAKWQDARLVPSANLRVLRFDYPVNDFFQAFKDGACPGWPKPAPTWTALHRDGLTLWRRSLEPRAAFLLEELCSGVPLGVAVAALEAREALEALEARSPTAIASELSHVLPAWLSSWVQGGLFCGIELP